MKYFVYKYYVADHLVYVGKATGNPYTRFWSHNKKENRIRIAEFEFVDKIGIIEFNNQADMEIYELYLLVTKKPLWNERDIYPHVRSQVKIIDSPGEKFYTLQEFYNEFNNGNCGKIRSEVLVYPEVEILYWTEEAKRKVRPKHPKGKVRLFYSGNELLYVISSAGATKTKYYNQRFNKLIQEHADFSQITRMEDYAFRTGAEVKMFEKYMIAKFHPKWSIDEYMSESVEIMLSNIPIPQVICDEEKRSLLESYTNAMDYYQKKLNGLL